ncbi:GUN4 domain-containing protein [Oscillatoria sp. FACHB-1406]|uniref:GUN4 domain-containing protein n=1 Tax=Oscillatoria sp. FACHB-1406 TaxID=2692846 RepID=UPI001688FAE1|nr:GUN4 domain-containing protein [Oscillatoria sp. FACHB-1406]MBD2576082.1 GUN4 N-terminal ARM-like repeat domain-containing protein [Oscillatoria sp. FACHB-1406]
MIDSNTQSIRETASDEIAALRQQLFCEPEKKQLTLLDKLASFGDEGLSAIAEFLQASDRNSPTPALGKAELLLLAADTPQTRTFLETHFPDGIVPLHSEQNIDCSPIARALREQDFLNADRLTLEKLCELVGPSAIQRKWLFFSEVEKIPIADLRAIDSLWRVYSEGKFGYSVQREIWLAQGKDFGKLWSKIGWKTDKNWTRYPNEFIWNVSAPRGHLPLSNQLRGVRVIAKLFDHPAWSVD